MDALVDSTCGLRAQVLQDTHPEPLTLFIKLITPGLSFMEFYGMALHLVPPCVVYDICHLIVSTLARKLFVMPILHAVSFPALLIASRLIS